MTENKKPLSLNQRHSRLLQDLSASHSRPSSHVPSTAQVKPSNIKFQGRRRLFNTISFEDSSADDEDGDDMPKFSVFSDLDSTPEEKSTEKSEKVILEGRRRLCRASARIDNDNIGLKFSEISEEQKMEKPEESGNVMLKDRRHLCKASPAVDDGYQGSKFSETSDFDSPAVAKNINRRDLEGANEIRSILNDLSSKLDFLSIEKNRIPKTIDQPNTADLSIPSDSTSDIASHYSPVSVVESKSELCDNREDSSGDSKDDDNSGTIRKLPITEGHIKNETSSDYGNNEISGQSMLSNAEEGQESGDSCVVLSNKGLYKSSHRQSSKFNGEVCSSSGVDLSDDEVSEQPFTLSGPESTYTLCGKLAKMLYPHQRDGLKWLWSLHCQGKGGILGDDMGLGKTMQICSFLAGLFQSCLIKRALIVAPKTLLSHWIKELSMVGLSGKTREYHGTSVRAREYELRCILQDKGVLLTTYDIVRNNSKSLCGDFHHNDEGAEDSITWDYMILDEGHLIKNPSTQRAKSLLEIPSAQRIIISGTPIQNNLKELWALFHFCCPELLHDKYWFKEKYEYKILRGNDKHASDRDKRIGSATAKELRDRIQPYFLRRLKSEVFGEDGANTAKVSKKNEIIVWLKLTSCQRQLYEAFLNSELVLSAFDGSPLAALTILKKICDHPMLLTKRAAEDVLEGMDSMMNHEDKGMAEKLAMHIADITERENLQEVHDNVSCKISFIMSLLDNLIPKGHNVLIFSQTRKMLNLIQESLTSNDYEFVRIDGTTKACDRVNIVNDFQESVGAPIFLLTSQVGGLGLTLTRADRVIVVDPAWNPSTDNQSVDRAYRIGQKKDVIVYRLMTCGTVEEKIYRKQIFKGGLFRTATEQKEQIRYFGQQDLRELFSLPKQGFDVSLTQQQLHEEHDSQYVMNAFLKDHIKFLETKGIAGVSHHSLLFSKTAPTITEEAEEGRMKAGAFAWGGASHEHDTGDGAGGLAFKPKDVDVRRGNSSVNSPAAPTESDIKAQIGRLTQIFADKVTISKLPDKGARIERRLAQLNCELERMKGEKEVIDLDDVTDELQRVLSV